MIYNKDFNLCNKFLKLFLEVIIKGVYEDFVMKD